jgi:outer membrane protein assembly factor BamB
MLRPWIRLALGAALALMSSDEKSVNWPHWRGAHRDGVSAETGWTNEGNAEPSWKANVGIGHSCPSVVDGRLYTLGFDEGLNLDVVICLDADTGEELWARTYPGRIRNSGHGGGTLTTPAVDGERVYVSTREGELRCLDSETGEVIWQRDLADEHGTVPLDYGFGGSPLVLADRVICNLGKTVAVDKQTGETLWATRNHLAMYSTPTRFQLDGEPTIAVFTKEGLFLLDEAQGTELRHFPWRKGKVTVNASTPVVVGDKLFISSSYNHGCALVDISAAKPEALWESRVMRTQLSGVVLYEEHLYGFDESMLKCIDLAGKEQWRKRGLGMGALMASDGRLIVASEKGDLVVVAASPDKYRELSRKRIFTGGTCWTNPVLADGRIYMRNAQGELVCLDHRQP